MPFWIWWALGSCAATWALGGARVAWVLRGHLVKIYGPAWYREHDGALRWGVVGRLLYRSSVWFLPPRIAWPRRWRAQRTIDDMRAAAREFAQDPSAQLRAIRNRERAAG